MEIVYAEHEDGTLVVADYLEKYVNKKKYKQVTVAKPVDMHAHTELYSGYTGELVRELYPGAPILTYYDSYPEWKYFQPQTYKFNDVYRMTKSGTRGTLAGAVGDFMVSAYHVISVGTFLSDEGYFETPNTPCAIRTLSSEKVISRTSMLTEPAEFVLHSPISHFSEYNFVLDRDVALASPNRITRNECLFFENGKPRFVKCEVVGVVSGVLGSHVYVAPLRDVMPEVPVFFTGSTSGTGILRPYEKAKMYIFDFKFGKHKVSTIFKNGWVFEGEVTSGDSGAPVFRVL